jgi:hypothetical protein
MQQLAENLWIKRFPLSILGTQHGRNVTVIRLKSGKLIVHSMADFSSDDVAEIRSLGEPGWLVESMLLHDTYSKQGHEAFGGNLPFLGPPGFGEVVKFPTQPLLPAPAEWADEVAVIEIKGAPRLKEHAFIHLPTRTLIVADLVFNFSPDEKGWDRFFHRYLAGLKRYPGMTRVFRMCVTDRKAFHDSINQVMDTGFDRLIVGHGDVIESDGRDGLARAVQDALPLS